MLLVSSHRNGCGGMPLTKQRAGSDAFDRTKRKSAPTHMERLCSEKRQDRSSSETWGTQGCSMGVDTGPWVQAPFVE